LDRQHVVPAQHHLLPEAERVGPHPDQHLAGPRPRHRLLAQGEALDAGSRALQVKAAHT
jgi:hypothetical protein